MYFSQGNGPSSSASPPSPCAAKSFPEADQSSSLPVEEEALEHRRQRLLDKGIQEVKGHRYATNSKHQSTTHPRKTQSDGRQRVEQKGKDFPKRGLLAKPCWPPDFHSMYWPSAVHGFLSAICSLPFWALESSCPTTIDTLRRAQPHPGLFVPQQDPISFWPAIAVPLRLEAGSKCAAIAPSP